MAGTFSVDVSAVEDLNEKRLLIEAAARRGVVMLHFPGHIMLYLGTTEDGVPMVIHAFSEFLTPCEGTELETINRVDRVAVSDLTLGAGSSRRDFLSRIARQDLGVELPEKGRYTAGNVFLPVNEASRAHCKKIVEQIIAQERPDVLLPTIGGQTGLEAHIDLAVDGLEVTVSFRVGDKARYHRTVDGRRLAGSGEPRELDRAVDVLDQEVAKNVRDLDVTMIDGPDFEVGVMRDPDGEVVGHFVAVVPPVPAVFTLDSVVTPERPIDVELDLAAFFANLQLDLSPRLIDALGGSRPDGLHSRQRGKEHNYQH